MGTSLREINTLLISQHVNVVTVREIVVGSNMDQIYIVMDFVQHDLKSLMEKKRRVDEKLQLLERSQGRLRSEESREVSHESTTSPEAVRRKRRIRREDKRKLKEEKLREKYRSLEETTSSNLGDKDENRGYTSEIEASSSRD